MRVQSTEHRAQKKLGLIFVVSGPSGSGKTTLLTKLIKDKDLKKILIKSTSLATRPKRSGEREGQDYFFCSLAQFKEQRRAKKILEWTRYLGYYYATPRDFVEEKLVKGKNLILSLDLRGALKIKRLYPQNTITIFIAPPSLGALRERIEKRCHTTKKEEVQNRLKLATKEVAVSNRYDYCLVNQDLDETAKRLKEIVLKNVKPKI